MTEEDGSEVGLSRGRGDATRQKIKRTARRLFATRGLDAVSIRQIVVASGQKNAGAVNYYFQSKDALIRELILDVARILEEDRARLVDELEASGNPITVRDLLTILMHVPGVDSQSRSRGPADEQHALRFLNLVMINHRDMVFDAVKDGVDQGTRRCVAHLRAFMPADLPPAIVQQRLMFLVLEIIAVCSSREAAREHPEVWRSLWGQPGALDNALDTFAAMVTAPASAETLRAGATATATKRTRRKRAAG
jgi:AcrR family transcriptional regulator